MAFSPTFVAKVEAPPLAPKESLYLPKRADLLAALRGDWDKARQLLASWYFENEVKSPLFAEAFALSERISQNRETKGRLFAQTYAAATILFSLASTEEIVAIPRGFREMTALFPREKISRVHFDVESCDGEKVALMKPHIAFIAPYSNLSTVSMLGQLSIPVYRLSHLTTVGETLEAIECVGKAAGHADEGRFLRLFVELALDQIDHCLEKLPMKQNVLYLTEVGQLSLPAKKSLTADLLKRLGLNLQLGEDEWCVPVSQEDIKAFSPELVICSSFKPHPPYAWVDESIQHSPTQFMALAYLDIAASLYQSRQIISYLSCVKAAGLERSKRGAY